MNKKIATPKSRTNAKTHNTSVHLQRARILAELTQAAGQGRTTIELRELIDVLHPAGRIFELRDEGHTIYTRWDVTENAQGRKHRNARYVLIRQYQEAIA